MMCSLVYIYIKDEDDVNAKACLNVEFLYNKQLNLIKSFTLLPSKKKKQEKKAFVRRGRGIKFWNFICEFFSRNAIFILVL